MDLAFVVDASGSIDPINMIALANWKRTLAFVNEVISRFNIGRSQTHVAFVKFSSSALVEFGLNSPFNNDLQTLQSVVGALEFIGGTTNTESALRLLMTDIFTVENGDRPDFPNLAFVITDGQSNINPDQTIPTAMAVRRSGIRILVIGVTNQTNPEELNGIASSIMDVYYIDYYSDFSNITDGVVGRGCPPEGDIFILTLGFS